jgi:Glycosyltransferase family 9 (heptosyltransferase)
MFKAEEVLITPYLNEHLLGDKIVLSAIINYLAHHNPMAHILGVEKTGSFSMADYMVAPHSIMEGRVNDIVNKVIKEHFVRQDVSYKLILCCDHNSLFPEQWISLREVKIMDLWDTLKQCSEGHMYPKLNVKPAWLSEADSLLERVGVEPNDPYIVVHIRLLNRQPWKNSDIAFIREIVRQLINSFSIPVIIVGSQDERSELSYPGLIDLGMRALTIEQTAGLLAKALLFIGGDSGPIHLAGALGCPVLGIGYYTEKFGPFVPQEQSIGLFGPVARGRIMQLKNAHQVVESIRDRFSKHSVCVATV